MINKPLIAAISGFLAGGLLVSVAATTFDKPATPANSDTSMSEMTNSLKPLKGDEFDKAFIDHMIAHHQGAIDMAKLIETNAKHDQLKQLGQDIISAQSKEIDMMQSWQVDWGYKTVPTPHDMHNM
jgi:uncharacterized protein (DUF305 family)